VHVVRFIIRIYHDVGHLNVKNRRVSSPKVYAAYFRDIFSINKF